MPLPALLSVRRSDLVNKDPVLLRVEQNGHSSLDLRLIATDGSSVFVANINSRKVSAVRSSLFSGTDDEWRTLFGHLLLREMNATSRQLCQSIDLIATVQEGDDNKAIKGKIMLTIRRDIAGITQRLAELVLMEDDAVSFDSIAWALESADTVSDLMKDKFVLQDELADMRQRLADAEAELKGTTSRHEAATTQLLQKFAALLNTKKLKIRDQQRLLSRANLRAETASEEEKDERASLTADTKTRGVKRKGKPEPDVAPDPPSSDHDDTASQGTETTNASSGDEVDAALPKAAAERPKAYAIPPRRELPAGMSKAVSANESTAKRSHIDFGDGNNDDDDETDDEL